MQPNSGCTVRVGEGDEGWLFRSSKGDGSPKRWYSMPFRLLVLHLYWPLNTPVPGQLSPYHPTLQWSGDLGRLGISLDTRR